MPDTIETLLKRNLHEVFGERDAKRRREALFEAMWFSAAATSLAASA